MLSRIFEILFPEQPHFLLYFWRFLSYISYDRLCLYNITELNDLIIIICLRKSEVTVEKFSLDICYFQSYTLQHINNTITQKKQDRNKSL